MLAMWGRKGEPVMAAEPEYYSLRQVATKFNLDPRTLRRWAAKGALQVTRIGPSSRLRVSLAEVKKLAREIGQK